MAIIQELESYVQSYPAGMETVTDVSLSQNENGRQLRFKIIGVTIPAGSVATISGTKPDGVVYSKAGTIEGSDTVIFDEDVQMTAVFGTWYAKIRIFNSGNTIASARVRFIIDKDPVDAGSVPSDSQLDGLIAEMEAYVEEARSVAYGSPLTASTAAAMTDQTKVYVYTGSEAGYTFGDWYYWDGNSWEDGGVYNAMAVDTDKTLSVADKAADGKATGEALEHRIPVYSEDEYTSDSTPYLYRQTGGGVAVGTRELDEIVGGSVGWNQLCTIRTSDISSQNVVQNSKTDKSLNFTVTSSASGWSIIDYSTSTIQLMATHKILLSFDYQQSKILSNPLVVCGGTASQTTVLGRPASTTDKQRVSVIGTVTTGMTNGKVFFQTNQNDMTIDISNVNVFDLTLLLGSTIADYIYSLETATAGSGIAKLKEWGFFTEDYYAYDAGSLQSVTGVSAHEMVGKNLLNLNAPHTLTSITEIISDDEYVITTNTNSDVWKQAEYELKNMMDGVTYTLSVEGIEYPVGRDPRIIIMRNGATIGDITVNASAFTFTAQEDSVYRMIIRTSQTGNPQIGERYAFKKLMLRDGGTSEYEPYTKHTYPLDSSVTLRGILKLDSNNKLYFDGDVYPPVGLVNRRYGIVNLGTLNWNKETTANGGWRFYAGLADHKKVGTSEKQNMICSKYETVTALNTWNNVRGISGNGNNNSICVCDMTYSDATTFKSAMNDVYLVYELATSTTEQADPYASVQICAEGGTEEYITTGIVPVGHNTKYPANLRERLDSIPDLPTTAGTYKLSVTIVSGKPVYQWVTT